MSDAGLKKTALWEFHRQVGARLVPFAGYDMPVQYKGVIAEHEAVRKNAGLFDVAHMGLASVRGRSARAFLDHVCTRDLSKLEPGNASYTLLCKEDGGTIDDLIVYAETDEIFWLVLNASNKEKDFAHLEFQLSHSSLKWECDLISYFDDYAILALQGPKTAEILRAAGLSDESGARLKKTFSFFEATFKDHRVRVAATGYTGEVGCEIFVKNQDAHNLWDQLLKAGEPFGLVPCGLAARDTLRTEMGYSLYGHELNETINPIEAGLSWAVCLDKKFVGRDALASAKAAPKRKLVALRNPSSKQAPRPDMRVMTADGRDAGFISSGTYSPSLGYAIGMALVDAASDAPYSVKIREQLVPFEKCTRPFYKKAP